MDSNMTDPQPNGKPVSPRRRVDKRAALINIGTVIFTQKGFSSTGLDEIVQAADVPKGSFYYYFSSKEEFAIAVIGNYGGYFSRKLERILGDLEKTPLVRLKAFTVEASAGMTRFDFKRGCLIGNLGQEMASLEENFRVVLLEVLEQWRARFADCLQQAKDSGEILTPVAAATLSHFFWCAWEGAILCAKLERSAVSLDIITDVFFNHTLEPAPTH
jgi:TetR/AcrR family transcriptional repressor of nem operon